MIETKERKIKENLVNEVHVKRTGEPRKIKYDSNKALYMTILPDGKRAYAKTKLMLIDKLFEYYGLTLADMTVKGVFLKALEVKAETENVDVKTIQRLRADFYKFIDDDFSKKDIRTITAYELKAYTQKLTRSQTLTKKDFFKYKGILNLTFDYAVKREIGIISYNPVLEIENKKYYKNCDTSEAKPEEKILSADDIEKVKDAVRKRMAWSRYEGYFIYGYVILIAIETGMRVGELCSIKWSDIHEDYIHIHSQQLSVRPDGATESIYYYVNWTKDERGDSKGGREFPLTNEIKSILDELKALQEGKNIHSEYVFCNIDGQWIKTHAYETCLRRLMQKLGFNVTNNHAFRMSLNSNVFIPKGIDVAMRAKLLGHSIETNQKYYSFARLDGNKEVLALLNG